MHVTTSATRQDPLKIDEQILVVKRSNLFSPDVPSWHGLNDKVFTDFFERVQLYKEFHPRSLMENDPTYKQIIPYLIFSYETSLFLMQRAATAGEQRLKNKYTLGIGGHIRKDDMRSPSDTIMTWAEREFHEEVQYHDDYRVTPLGILNDDTNPVGQVHLGFVLLIQGVSPSIKVHSELKSGKLYSPDECRHFYDSMEGWSQIVLNFLQS